MQYGHDNRVPNHLLFEPTLDRMGSKTFVREMVNDAAPTAADSATISDITRTATATVAVVADHLVPAVTTPT